MSKRRVVVTGLGVVSPVGSSIKSAWDAILRGESSIDKLANGPGPIHNSQRLCWRGFKRLVDTAKIVVGDVQRDGGDVIVELLAKAVRQSREPALAHAERKVLPLDVAG